MLSLKCIARKTIDLPLNTVYSSDQGAGRVRHTSKILDESLFESHPLPMHVDVSILYIIV